MTNEALTNVADILNVVAAGGGLAVLLVMALVPLMVDRHGPRERGERAPSAVVVPGRRAATEGVFAGPGTIMSATRPSGAPAVGGRA